MNIIRLLAVATAAIGIAGASVGAQAPSSAARELRALWRLEDYREGARRGAELVAANRGDVEVQVWTVMHRERAGWYIEAADEAKALIAKHPGLPSIKLLDGYMRVSQARAERSTAVFTRQLVRSDPRNADYAWVHTLAVMWSRRYANGAAFADSALPRLRDSTMVLLQKAEALKLTFTNASIRDSAVARRSLATYELAARSGDAGALRQYGQALLELGRAGEALPVIERALRVAPASAPLHEQYWAAILAQPAMTAEEKQKRVETDVDALLAARPNDPIILQAAAGAYSRLKLTDKRAAMRQRILEGHPASVEAQRIRYQVLSAFGDSVNRKLIADTTAAVTEHRRRLREFIADPRQPVAYTLGQAYWALYLSLRDDPAMTDADLVMFAEKLLALVPYDPQNVGVYIPIALADRNLRLDLATRMVNAKIARRTADVDEQYIVGILKTVGEYAHAADYTKATTEDALAWINFKSGRVAEAEKGLAKALELQPKHVMALYHMARIRELSGNLEEAKRFYARGVVSEATNRSKLNTNALQRLHLAEGGTAEGFDAYLANVKAAERADRRKKIEAGWTKAGPVMPAFDLELLGGGRFSSASTKGKIVVVNFWGTWCGPCVAEADDIQRLHERYRNDPDVVFITVDNDASVEVVNDFMKKRRLDFPVLLDKKFINVTAPITSFPTTWFVDRDGRIAFVQKGASDQLLEESIWRVDMLKGGVASGPASAASTPPAPALPVRADDVKLTMSGALPPHDQVPYLMKNIALTPEQQRAVEAVRASYYERIGALQKEIVHAPAQGPEQLFALAALERRERAEVREALDAQQQKAFDEAVAKMVQARQNRIQVRPPAE